MPKKILIVDDEPNICEILMFNLQSDGYETVSVNSAEQAIDELNSDYSLILLDVMMGGMSGYKLAEQLRKEGNRIPIIFLTAKDTENDMLTGFSVGADDYISKPFSLKEISARVKAVLSRQKQAVTDINKFVYQGFEVDFDKKELKIDSEYVGITKTEYDILEFFIKNKNRVYSRGELIELLWPDNTFITDRTVDVHIARLRKKMGQYASLIFNRSGYGYRFNAD